MAEYDISAPLENRLSIIDAPPEGAVASFVLLRADGRPATTVVVEQDLAGRSAPEVAAILAPWTDALGTAPVDDPWGEGLGADVEFSVMVCTRDRPVALRQLLTALERQEHRRFEVVVVDNAPKDAATKAVVDEWSGERVRYVVAPVAGLSRARNVGVAAASHHWIAMIDDDEVPDPRWLSQAAAVIAARHPDVVTGPMLPAQLRTEAQHWFEAYGGHSKGRGMRRFEFGPGSSDEFDPYFPLPAFGAGGNMFFNKDVLRRIGGFDESLGAGTPTQGAEDTLALTQVLMLGGTIAYEPGVLVWHYHREDMPGLHKQFFGYGSGLAAFYIALVFRHPRSVVGLLRLAPRALRAFLHPRGERLASVPADFPKELLREKNRGLVRGPWLAWKSGVRPRPSRAGRGA